MDLDEDNGADVQPLPFFRVRLSDDPTALVPSATVAQVFELLIRTATVDLDLLGRSVRERQLQDVRHVAGENNLPLDTGPIDALATIAQLAVGALRAVEDELAVRVEIGAPAVFVAG